METKDIEEIKKVDVDITTFKEKLNDLVVDGEESIMKAESIGKQAKALKSLAKAATELEWKIAKKDYKDSQTETEKKKIAYYAIRDKRNKLMGDCDEIRKGADKKIEDFRAECVRKAEEERLAKEREEREKAEAVEREKTEKADLIAKEEEEKKKAIETEAVVKAQCEHGKYSDETCEICGAEPCKDHICYDGGLDGCFCSECGIGLYHHGYAENENCSECAHEGEILSCSSKIKNESKPPENVAGRTRTPPTNTLQKSEDGKNEAITGQIEIKVFDVKLFYGALMRAERGVQEENLTITVVGLEDIARKHDCKPGDIVIAGARVTNHGD